MRFWRDFDHQGTRSEIRAHIAELYGVTVSAELISKVTDAVLDEVSEWQSRPLEEVYAIVLLHFT